MIRDRDRSPELESFLERPLFASLATASEDGPRSSPVWFLWADALWIISNDRTDSFPERIRKDPRCAVSIVDYNAGTGLVEHVGMRGRASVRPFEAERARTLLRRYLGQNEALWDTRFRNTLIDPENVLIAFTPETVVVRDVSYTIGSDADGSGAELTTLSVQPPTKRLKNLKAPRRRVANA